MEPSTNPSASLPQQEEAGEGRRPHSPQFLKKRKFLMVLPLLVLPSITLLFWSFGGGRVNRVAAQQAQNGLNMQLPGAHLKNDRPLDKLSYYEKAALDSLKLQQLMDNDPYYQQHNNTFVLPGMDTFPTSMEYGNNKGRSSSVPNQNFTYADRNETKVYQRLAQLDAALNNASTSKANQYIIRPIDNVSVSDSDVDRLELLMQSVNQKGGEDPELKQLNGMMDKILDIQHPERVREKIKQTSETKKGQVFAVTAGNNNAPTSLLISDKGTTANDTFPYHPSSTNGFFSLDEDIEKSIEQQNAMPAVIHQTQTLVEGAIVKLRLQNDIYVNGILIPKNHFVFGTASLNGERLTIRINNIRYKNSLFPVDLEAYDMDGIEGIYIPGAISRDVAKGSADRAAQQLDFSTLNPSVGAQAANAGMQAAKALLSHKIKLVKVTVEAGYKVLLRDEQQKQNN